MVALQQAHVNELGVHAFDIGQHQELLDGGVIAHVAFELWIGVAPLLRGLAEQGDVEHVSLGSVGDGGLRGRDLRRDQVRLHRVGMDAVVELGEGAIEIPGEREAAVFVVFEPLEFFDEVDFEFRRNPGSELKGNIPVSVGSAIAA